METDFSAFFLLVETIIRIRLNSVFKKYSCKGKQMVGEKNFPANRNHSPLHFSEAIVSFFPSSRKVFFNKTLYSSWWKRIF